MAYQNTGYQRAKSLTIKVTENGQLISTNVLPFLSAFTHAGIGYQTLTANQIDRIPIEDYMARVTAYAAYVQEYYADQFPDILVSTVGSRVYNPESCPLP